MPLYKVSISCQEAFSQDSCLVRKGREEYYKEYCLTFDSEICCDLVEVFQCMIETTGLLGSVIYEIQEACTEQRELQHANYAIRTLPKGLRFFCAVSPLESPKVMGLMGIHHPNALCPFNGVTHCPWCGKEGQNEGTIINHLRTVHYKWASYAKKMFPLPINHVGGHPAPWPEELPASSGVILLGITTCMKNARSTFPRQEPGWRIQGRRI